MYLSLLIFCNCNKLKQEEPLINPNEQEVSTNKEESSIEISNKSTYQKITKCIVYASFLFNRS
jgi:hypothetical protein